MQAIRGANESYVPHANVLPLQLMNELIEVCWGVAGLLAQSASTADAARIGQSIAEGSPFVARQFGGGIRFYVDRKSAQGERRDEQRDNGPHRCQVENTLLESPNPLKKKWSRSRRLDK